MQYKLWHLVVAFVLGTVIVAGATLAQGSLSQGRLTLNHPAVTTSIQEIACGITNCDIYQKLAKMHGYLTGEMRTQLNSMNARLKKLAALTTNVGE